MLPYAGGTGSRCPALPWSPPGLTRLMVEQFCDKPCGRGKQLPPWRISIRSTVHRASRRSIPGLAATPLPIHTTPRFAQPLAAPHRGLVTSSTSQKSLAIDDPGGSEHLHAGERRFDASRAQKSERLPMPRVSRLGGGTGRRGGRPLPAEEFWDNLLHTDPCCHHRQRRRVSIAGSEPSKQRQKLSPWFL
jgi:hypothetical protein